VPLAAAEVLVTARAPLAAVAAPEVLEALDETGVFLADGNIRSLTGPKEVLNNG
jgi:hypothetical protein